MAAGKLAADRSSRPVRGFPVGRQLAYLGLRTRLFTAKLY